MNSQNLTTLRMLRECQSRSAREQQILSGRDWLFVTALVQFLTALYPVYRWITELFVVAGAYESYVRDMGMAIGMLTICAVLLVLWWWGKYAPFRAACAALGFYVLLQVAVALFYPTHIFDGIASKVLVLFGLLMAVRTGYRRRHSG